MGLFSSKKTIVVSSTVYNMAGDEATRPNFMKNSIYSAVMSPHNPYLGETIVRNLLLGPAIYQRNFLKWAIRQNYPGLPTFSVVQEKSVDPTIVAPFITIPSTPSGLDISIQTASVIQGDYEPFVDQYILENFPENYNTDYVSSYSKPNNEVTIQWEGGGSVMFTPTGFDKNKYYVVANHFFFLPSELQNLVTGSTTVGVLTKPSTSGYTLDNSVNTGIVNYPMNYDERIITTYVGPGAPGDTDETTSESDSVNFDGLDETWTKTTYEGGNGDTEETVSRKHFLEITEYRQVYTDDTQVSLVVNPDTPIVGVTQTIETRRIGDHLRPIWDWRIDTQDTITLEIIDGSHVFIYEIGDPGTEPTLDALLETIAVSPSETEYFPFMPVRLDNVSIKDPVYDDITGSGLYELTNRAYRRAAGGGHRFSKLVDEIEDNPDIDDIDYAFTHHGVALNVLEPASRRYMYTWFKNVSAFQNTSSGYMSGFQTEVATYLAAVQALNDWIFAQGDSARPGYGDPRPSTPELDTIESTTIRLAPSDPQLENLDQRTTWVNISETLHSGAPTNPDTGVAAIENDIWLQDGTAFAWTVTNGIFPNAYSKDFEVEKMEMFWQTGSNAYKKLTIWGLVHNNLVYSGEAVTITGKEGLADVDPTGFIIPLHYPTVKDLGIVDATQMAMANTFIVFNTFEIVKQKWYEGIIGMIIIIIVIIILAVIFAPAAGGGVGLLGSNAAVGAAMGLTGTAAIVAGAITNALVAIAISQIVTAGSKALFGDKWGAIVAAVVNLAITLGAGGVTFDNLSELGTTANILKITSAIANGYQGYTQGAIAEIGDDFIENQEDFDTEMKKIEKMLKELRGGNDLQFDPLSLTDSVKGNDSSQPGAGYITETLDEFIRRTMMTGSEVVDISLQMVGNFADLSLELP